MTKNHPDRAQAKAANMPHLYLLASASLCRGRNVVDVVKQAIQGGVDCVQLREKGQSLARLLTSSQDLRELCRREGVPFIVNDSLELAQKLAADGLHLGQDDMPVEEARRLLGPKTLIGLSTHNEQQIHAARARWDEGVIDYVGLGPIFVTATKDAGAPIGAAVLDSWRDALGAMPCFPIGGIQVDNVKELYAAGARRIAVSSVILGAADPAQVAAQLRQALLLSADD